MWRLILAFTLVGDPVRVETRDATAGIDARVVEQGLRTRLGPTDEPWRLVVGQAEGADLDVLLERPDGTQLRRIVTVEGDSIESRSRELASFAAVIIEGSTPPPQPGRPEPLPIPSNTPAPLAFVALSGRLGAGPPRAADVDGGLGLRLGGWFARDHVQPLVAIDWSRTVAGALTLDGLRFGAGAAFGGPLAGQRVWVGGGVVPRALWVRAKDRATPSTFVSSTEIAAVGQLRWPRLVLGLRLGADLNLPAVRAVGARDSARWGIARFMLAIEVGAILWTRTSSGARTGGGSWSR